MHVNFLQSAAYALVASHLTAAVPVAVPVSDASTSLVEYASRNMAHAVVEHIDPLSTRCIEVPTDFKQIGSSASAYVTTPQRGKNMYPTNITEY